MCQNGLYTEHGINGAHGFHPGALPARARLRRHRTRDARRARRARRARQHRRQGVGPDRTHRRPGALSPRRVLVTGAGPVGLLAPVLRLRRSGRPERAVRRTESASSGVRSSETTVKSIALPSRSRMRSARSLLLVVMVRWRASRWNRARMTTEAMIRLPADGYTNNPGSGSRTSSCSSCFAISPRCPSPTPPTATSSSRSQTSAASRRRSASTSPGRLPDGERCRRGGPPTVAAAAVRRRGSVRAVTARARAVRWRRLERSCRRSPLPLARWHERDALVCGEGAVGDDLESPLPA